MATSGGRISFAKMQYPATVFYADGGAPTAPAANANNYSGWSFPAGADAGITCPYVSFVGGWNLYAVNLVWYNPGAVSGNVRWRVQVKKLDISIDLVTIAPYVNVLNTPAAPSQNLLFVSPGLVNNQNTNQAAFGSEYALHIIREGSTDGVAGPMVVPGVSITRVG